MTIKFDKDVYVPALIQGVTLANYRALGQYAIYQVDSNSDEELKTYGISAELIKVLSKNFTLNVVYDYNKLDFSQ